MRLPLCSTLAAACVSLCSLVPGAQAQQMVLALDGGAPSITVPKAGISLDVSAIDKTVNPCQDFYQYACGNWRKNNPVPADKVRWGRFDELGERNLYTVYALLQQAADKPTTPLQVKYGNYFAACMDDSKAEALGAKPLDPMLKQIAALQDKAALARLVAQLRNQYGGVGVFFGFGSQQDQKDSTQQIPGISQGGLSLPDRDYYLQQDARMSKIRDQYTDHLTKMFTLLGDTPDQAATEAKAVLTIETALAKGSMPRVDMRTPANVYHMKTLAELQSMTPEYKWADYFSEIKVPINTLNVATPNYFTAMNEQLSSASLADLKSYLRWHATSAFAGSLSKAFVDEDFHFFAQVLGGQKEQAPLWKRCTQQTDRALGEAVGQDWVARYFTPQAKANMQELVHQLEASLGEDINHLDWMSDTTKVEAQKKLAAFRDKIGYPEVWRDYASLTIKRDDRVGNRERTNVFDSRRNIDKIGKPVDEKEWGMTPPTVNAYYSPSNNDINFPAGILQPPFYDFKIDPPVNFGAIGVVIGHEMTHGFDDQGSQYDAQGNVRSWWTKEDRAEFDKRTDCEVKEYGAFEPVPGTTLNGKLTLGENTADNGGLQVSYMALHKELAKLGGDAATKKIDGYTPDQRYFLGYAQVWCENTREETALMRAKTDPHSPGQFRVIGAVQNSSRFAEAFSCKQGDPMAPVNACRVW